MSPVDVGFNYVHADHLGTPRAITRPSDNAVVWKWDNTDPFGANLPNEDPSNTGTAFKYNLRFPGQYADQETGTFYNYYRDYDASTGRYIQSDPIGLRGGINTYAYVGGNPLIFVDPLGLKTYQCTKPLNALTEKLGLPASTFASKYVPAAYHQYSCVVDKDGKITCGGQDHEGSPLRSPGKRSEDTKDAGQCKESQPDNTCFEDCLKKEWKKTRPMYGIPFGQDCQEYDDDVNATCRKQCKLKK